MPGLSQVFEDGGRTVGCEIGQGSCTSTLQVPSIRLKVPPNKDQKIPIETLQLPSIRFEVPPNRDHHKNLSKGSWRV